MAAPVAAVDIGTNTVRLLISDGKSDLERMSAVVGLGRGLSRTGHLDPRGREKAKAVLEHYAESISRTGAAQVRAVATSASREAADAGDFLAEVAEILGTAPEVITGDTEAGLSYAGATSDLGEGAWTVADIGGGSTEVITAQAGRSFDVGSVRITDLYLGEDRTGAGLEEARAWVRDSLEEVPGQSDQVVGVAGTWTSLAAMDQQLDPYDPARVHHFALTRGAVDGWVSRLSGLSLEETKALPGLDPRRAPVILGGALVAEVVMEHLGTGVILVSERDLLDGIVAGLLEQG